MPAEKKYQIRIYYVYEESYAHRNKSFFFVLDDGENEVLKYWIISRCADAHHQMVKKCKDLKLQ